MQRSNYWFCFRQIVTLLLWHSFLQRFSPIHPPVHIHFYPSCRPDRALCRIELFPVTHVLVDTWMLTVKPAYKLSNVTWNGLQTYMWHHLHSLLRHNWQYLMFWNIFFCSFIFLPVHPYFYLSTMTFTRPNDRWTDLSISLWPWHCC